ncbi:hypothetical protein GCM10009804_03190 [Kribbella hippodromi]|uniref:Uncharacterized protein n=1 Tax=Kribbella hippodromi TaxID=434347 RepID=A0ABP4MUA8_9ACTN
MADTSRTIKLKLDADAAGLVAATKVGEREVDRFTKSVDKKFRRSGEDSGKGFGSSLLKWFKGDGSKLLGEGGQLSGEAFNSGLGGALKTPIIGPAILAAAAGVVATVAPAAGAIVAGGIVAGFGAGLAGLGIAFAAKSEVVKAVWSKTLGDMGAQMQVLSKPFESTLISMAAVAKRTFGTFKPELDKAFKTIAPALTQFGDQLGQAFGKLAPAVAPLSQAFKAVLQSLGPAMQSALGSVSKGLQDLAASVQRSPSGLADLVKGLGDTVKIGLDIIRVLNDANGAIEKITGGFSGVDVVMVAVNSTLGAIKIALQVLLAPLEGAAKLLQKLGIISKDTGNQQDVLATNVAGAAEAAQKAATPAEVLTTKLNRQKAATDAVVQSMFRLQNLALGLSGAQINYQQALDDATAAVKQNGKNLDINTEKGRANKTALDNIASSANAQTKALIDGGKGWVAANTSAETSRQAFVRVATQMGLSRKAAHALAAQLIGIPPKKNVDLSVSGAAAAKAKVDKLAASVAALKNRTVYVNMVQSNIGGIPAGIRAPGRASGGPVSPGRTYLVGEQGPELLTMGSSGGHVTNARQTAAALQGGDTYVYVTIDGQQLQGRIDKTIRTSNRQLKRTVQAGAR